MMSAIVVGLGTIATAVGALSSEVYLAKKISTAHASLNYRNSC